MPEQATRRLLITPVAEQDLAEIWAYIAEDSPEAATGFVRKLESKFGPLLRHPGMGASRDQLQSGLRAWPFKTYCIYYMFDDETVTIVRVVHGARDVRALF